ncbi:MAG: M20/M25/M40 family metallo-hydrolase [Fidelibacterota bacterium]|nr:MAG: M20/M25/M40 family metallo-hydrolase [Candidatus Neomarinimicrobiota bacterium]
MSTNMHQRLIDLFLQLAAINATSGAEKPVAEFIRTFLAERGLDSREDDAHLKSGGNAGNVICRVGDGGDSVFLAHMDTARPTEQLQPQVHSDRITSDGTTILGADNRAGVAILLYALEQASRSRDAFQDFTAAFTVCEESNLSGSKHLILDDVIKMGYAFDSSLRPGHFIHATYGAVRFTTKVLGKAAHAGLEPEKGVNAIQAAGRAIGTLPLGRLDDELTVNIGTISGGTAVNVVPAETLVKGEIRGRENKRVEDTVRQISEIFATAADELGAAVDFTSTWDFEPYCVEPGHEAYRKLVAALETAGLEPVPHMSPGGSDANSLNAKGIPALNVGIGAQKPHSDDEFILIDDLVKSAEIALELIRT